MPKDSPTVTIATAAAELYWAEGWLAIYRALEAFLTLKALDFTLPKQWVDAGCGEGRFTELLRRAAREFNPGIGIDVDERRMERLISHDLFVERHVAYLSSLPVADASADAVLCNSVLEHCEHPRDVLSEFHRVLDINGKLFLTIPTTNFEAYLAGTSLFSSFRMTGLANRYASWMSRHIRHLHYWTPKGISDELQCNGFSVSHIEGFASHSFSAIGDILHLLRIVGIGGSRFSMKPPNLLNPFQSQLRSLSIKLETRATLSEIEWLERMPGAKECGMMLVVAEKR